MFDEAEIKKYSWLFLALVMGATGNVVTDKLNPPRYDPYTGKDGKAEATARQTADATEKEARKTEDQRIWTEIGNLRGNLLLVQSQCRDRKEDINILKRALSKELYHDTQ